VYCIWLQGVSFRERSLLQPPADVGDIIAAITSQPAIDDIEIDIMLNVNALQHHKSMLIWSVAHVRSMKAQQPEHSS